MEGNNKVARAGFLKRSTADGMFLNYRNFAPRYIDVEVNFYLR